MKHRCQGTVAYNARIGGTAQKIRVAMAQTNPVTGDLEGNLEQIVRCIHLGAAKGTDIILFPEAAITHYCCGARFDDPEFINYNKSMVEEVIAPLVPDDMVVLLGFIDYKGVKPNGRPRITNSVAVLQGGRVIDTYDKQLLANEDHHEDAHYFTPGAASKVTEVILHGRSLRIGTPICEDAWNQDHDRDIVAEMCDLGADIILCPNFSYFAYGKQQRRHALFQAHSSEKGIPVVVTMATGIGDIVKNIMVYDGGSIAFNAAGELIAECDRFKEDFRTVDITIPLKKERHKNLDGQTQRFRLESSGAITPRSWEKYEEIYEALTFAVKEHFKILRIPNAQVHVSGGIDSAVIAAIAADAFGPEHCIFISNPTEDNGDITKGNAQRIADTLGVPLFWNPTQGPYESVVASYEQSFGEQASPNARTSAQAVLRTVQGLMATHMKRSAIISAGNHTENILGWANFHDIGSVGVHAPLLDLSKNEVVGLAQYINHRAGKEIIPRSLYDGTTKPMAEVANAKEDPIDYAVMSGICTEMIRSRKTSRQLIDAYASRSLCADAFPPDIQGKSIYEHCAIEKFSEQVLTAFRLAQSSVYKSAQAAPGFVLSPRARGFSNREVLLDRYKGSYDIGALQERHGREEMHKVHRELLVEAIA